MGNKAQNMQNNTEKKEEEVKKVDSSDLELLLKHNNSIQQVRSLIADLEIRKSQLISDFNALDQRTRQTAEVALEKLGIEREEMKDYVINLDTGIVGPRPKQEQIL